MSFFKKNKQHSSFTKASRWRTYLKMKEVVIQPPAPTCLKQCPSRGCDFLFHFVIFFITVSDRTIPKKALICSLYSSLCFLILSLSLSGKSDFLQLTTVII